MALARAAALATGIVVAVLGASGPACGTSDTASHPAPSARTSSPVTASSQSRPASTNVPAIPVASPALEANRAAVNHPAPAAVAVAPSPQRPELRLGPDSQLEFRGLPAIARNRDVAALAVEPAFEGRGTPTHVAFVDVRTGESRRLVRVFFASQDPLAPRPTAAMRSVNEELTRGEFVAMTPVAEGASPHSATRVEHDGAEFGLTPLDPIEEDDPAVPPRGQLLDGPRTFDVRLGFPDGAPSWRGSVSNQPPRFPAIPRNCHAAFFANDVSAWIGPPAAPAFVLVTWSSGSGECTPWRYLFVDPALAGEAPSATPTFEASSVRRWP